MESVDARTIGKPGNRTLSSAKAAKQDEVYTQLSDIANELKHYRGHFSGKVVLCNCDDRYESTFFQSFALNFNVLGLKRLVCTSYAGSPIVGGQLPLMVMEGLKPYRQKEPYLVEINEVPDFNHDGAINREDVEHLLKHDNNATRLQRGVQLDRGEQAVDGWGLQQSDRFVWDSQGERGPRPHRTAAQDR